MCKQNHGKFVVIVSNLDFLSKENDYHIIMSVHMLCFISISSYMDYHYCKNWLQVPIHLSIYYDEIWLASNAKFKFMKVIF